MDPMRVFDPSKLKAAAAEYSSSESSQEDDDYLVPSTDPAANEFADFNPRKRRRTGRNAKESAALGIFGSDSEDEDRPGQRWKRKTLRNKGVSFVSQADQARETGDEHEDMTDDVDDEEEDESAGDNKGVPAVRARAGGDEYEEDEEEEEDTRGVGLGFGGGRTAQGLGWGLLAQSPQPAVEPPRPTIRATFDGSNPLGRGFVPTSANDPVLKVPDNDTSIRPQVARPSAFSSKPGKGNKGKVNPNSFGARMMAKMGYVNGQGLGKEGQGRNVIIEANLRPQNIGLGAVKEKSEQEKQEEKRQARLRGETVIDSDEEEKKKKKAARRKKAFGDGLRSGTGSGASTPRRQKPKYMTLDEVKKVAPGLDIPDAFTPILDLTGPGRKMLTSSSGLMTPVGGTGAENEGQVESRKLVKRAQNDFMAILEEWQSLQERKAFAELQLQQERQELEELENAMASHQATAAVFDELSHPAEDELLLNGGDSTKQRWDAVIALLRKAEESTSNLTVQAVKDEMASIAAAALHPLLKEMIDGWDPLEAPKAQYASDLDSIRGLLGLDRSTAMPRARSSATPYESMMYKLWLPRVSRAVRGWSVRDAEPMLAVYEPWAKVLPPFVRAHLLEQDIVRRLEEAVAKWEPKRKKSHGHGLPHLWLFPWLQHLPPWHLDPASTTGLVAEVKRKFRQLVDVWDFANGIVPGLKEWKAVLRPSRANDQWKPLVANHVLPSMARHLRRHFRVEPSDQEPYLRALSGVVEWAEAGLVAPALVAEILAAEVFPMWADTLYQWLVMEDVDYGELAQWAEWWHDEVLPAEIREVASVAREFERGLRLIQRALDLFDLDDDPGTHLPRPGRAAAGSQAAKVPGGNSSRRSQLSARADPTQHGEHDTRASFRQVVEDWCQENDLQFIPERKKVHSEGPLYRITARGDGRGGVLVFFRGEKLCLPTKTGVDEFSGESGGRDWDRLLTLVM